MSYLNDFTDEQRALIVSLPVRTGFWISHIDDIPGTQRDDEKERRALERVLKLIQSKTKDDAFTNDVVEFALVNKAQWPQWENHAGTTLADLPGALQVIKDTLPADGLKSFKKALWYIANVVAQAASEQGGEDDLSKEAMGSGLLHKALDRLSVKMDLSEPENVSDSEKAALQKLLQCLKG